MAEDKKIILQLEIDAQKGIENLIDTKDRIAKLKEEQKALNTSTLEGRKTWEAYNAQIKNLTKEQRSLENAVSQTASAMEFEAGSIAANRAELSKLTAEYKNLANPTEEQTKKIKELSDRLKEQESAIGNNSRNVGNYREEIEKALGSQNIFVSGISKGKEGFERFTTGVKGATLGFKGLGGAIAASGLGALLLILGSIVSYFKNTNEGSKIFAQIMAGLKATVGILTDSLSSLGKSLVGLFTEPTKSLKQFAQDLKDFIIGRFELLMSGVKGIGTAFKQLFAGQFSEAAKTAGKSLLDIQRATNPVAIAFELLGGKIKDAFNNIKDGALLAAELEKRMQNLIVAERNLSIETARRRGEVERLEKVADDTAAKSEDRVKSLQKSIDIQNKLTEDEVRLAEKRLDIIKQQNAITDSSEEDLQKEADALIKVIELRNQQAVKVQDLNNKMNALLLSIQAERDAVSKKAQEEIQKLFDAEFQLEVSRLENKKRLADLELKQFNEKTNKQREIELSIYGKTQEDIQRINDRYNKIIAENNNKTVREQLEIELELQRMQQDKLLENEELLDAERVRIVEEGRVRRLEIEADYNAKIIEENRKTADAVIKTWDEKFKDFFQNLFNGFSKFSQTINQAASVASQAVSVKLESDLSKNEKARQQDLKRFGKTQAERDRINKKYDDIAEKRRKQAAKDDATIKQIQAVINTATGVTQALAQSGPAGILTGALVAAAGALEVAAIQQNKMKLADGGLIKIGGKSHMEGGTTFRGTDGTVFEAEKDEVLAVVNKRDSAKLAYLSKINSVHGNPFFSNNRPSFKRNYFADGGMVARYSANNVMNESQNRNATIEAVQKQPDIVVRVSDINSAQNRVVLVKDRANVTK